MWGRASYGGPTFTGAALPICGVDVLVVVVRPWVLADLDEANLYVAAFALRFSRTVVLMAQDDHRVPTYYGPAAIVRVLRALPFELVPWRRIPYRRARRRFRLPIPPEPPATEPATSACEASADEPRTRTAARMARTTAR